MLGGENMANTANSFELLRAKPILTILDGDTKFGEIQISPTKVINNALPYLTGPMLCEISNKFGLPVNYSRNGGAQSRWVYLDDLFVHCIRNNRVSDLLSFLFSKEQFVHVFRGCTADEIDSAYQTIINTAIGRINGELYFSGHELIRVGNRFVVKAIGTAVTVETPKVKTIDRDYIVILSGRAMEDISEGNYDSAITKCRTLLEEVFFYVIEKKNEAPTTSGDIGKLYAQVKTLYNMHQDKNLDKRINSLLSGLEKILTAISDMRNKGSDAHGVGSNRIKIDEHHARLFVNSAMTMADFILSVGENQ